MWVRLVHSMTPEGVSVILVNTNQLEERELIIQSGGYAEHQFVNATIDGKEISLDRDSFHVKLLPGTGVKMMLNIQRHCNEPVMQFPWDRDSVD